MRILVIDDKPPFRRMLRTWLIKREHDVHEADGGPQAFRLLTSLPYDVVTLDLGMPQANGLSMIGEIRRLLPQCHIIIISGDADTSVAVESIKAGATACFEKPVDFDALELKLIRLANLSPEPAS